MRFICSILFLMLFAVVFLPAQVLAPFSTSQNNSRFDLGVGYERVQANAPVGICQCFGNTGGFADFSWTMSRRLALTAEFTGENDNDISSLGQNLTLMTYLAGPQLRFPIRRMNIYGEFLLGGAHGSNSYFPSGSTYATSANSFAFSPGGGIDIPFMRRFSIRAPELRYLHTSFPNGTTNDQNQLMIGGGLLFHFGESRKSLPHPTPLLQEPVAVVQAPPPPAPAVTDMNCTSAMAQVQAGTALEVAAVTQSAPAGLDVAISWTSSGGRVLGSGKRITIDTTSLPQGEYRVTGRAQVGDDAETARSCDVAFVVVPPPAPTIPARADVERDFKDHVHDVFFDLNKSDLRPDTIETLKANAEYLKTHDNIRFVVGGFADERGSSKYNLALGERRMHAVRDKLVEFGIAPDRIQLMTFGRDAQTCTESNEICWQQNRRVSFMMQP
jgi:outer membrane protein OmpA-like peptidoglycan-associated protein